MNFDVIITAGITLAATVATVYGATSGKLAEVRGQNAVAIAQSNQKGEEVRAKSDDDFRAAVLAELKRTQERMEILNDKYNTLAIDHATLVGQVQVLQNTRDTLTVENIRLKAENTDYKAKIDALDDENELQGQKILDLNAKIITLENGRV